MSIKVPVAAAILVSFPLLLAMTGDESPGVPQEPLLVDGALVFPEGLPVPASMTEIERRWLDAMKAPALRGETPPSADPIRCASEYEPMDGIVLAWEGGSSFTNIVAQMAAQITTTGDANVYVACDSNNEANSARNSMVNQGADASKAQIATRPLYDLATATFGDAAIYDRAKLTAGDIFDGPAVVQQFDSTTVICAGMSCSVDAWGNLIIDTGEAA